MPRGVVGLSTLERYYLCHVEVLRYTAAAAARLMLAAGALSGMTVGVGFRSSYSLGGIIRLSHLQHRSAFSLLADAAYGLMSTSASHRTV